MDLRLFCDAVNDTNVVISGSKSETNRLLILKALFPGITLHNESDSDDSNALRKALGISSGIVDVHHAGTAMRFLTAYFAIREGAEIILTGSGRMQRRPIKILVEALRQSGAEIDYMVQEGFPPLKISGKTIKGGSVNLDAGTSSQYVTAMMLIAPALKNGLTINLHEKITSAPYIQMTLNLLRQAGISASMSLNAIRIEPFGAQQPESDTLQPSSIKIESDWSSASYFYSLIALSKPGTTLRLSSFKSRSAQGDSILPQIYMQFGVATVFENGTIRLIKKSDPVKSIEMDLNGTPDLAQTIIATCFGSGLGAHLSGLHTLKIKETDRLAALCNELTRLGASVTATEDSISLSPGSEIIPGVRIETYNDHRMAMAFAPLALKVPIIISDAGVVSKSYPAFWADLKKAGFTIEEI